MLAACRGAVAELPPGANVAILGSTPELLDIARQREDLTVFAFDRSADFHQRMTHLRITSGETFVLGDWMESLVSYEGQFDLVLSDLTLGNVAYDLQPRFTSLVGDLLKPAGIAIDRVLTNKAGMKPLIDLEEKYRWLPCNLITLNGFNSEFLFTSELVETAGSVSSSALIDALLDRYRPTSSTLRWCAENVHKITPRGLTWDYGRPWSEVATGYFVNQTVRTVSSEPETSPFYGFVDVNRIEERS